MRSYRNKNNFGKNEIKLLTSEKPKCILKSELRNEVTQNGK
nr:MAG TPA: hypothetical protein [Caudoviricetes sp.]